MLRTFILSVAALGLSSTAFAHPDPVADDPQPSSKITKPQLPTQAEINKALDQMPDMNALMGGMMTVIKDEKFKDQMESSAKAYFFR